MRGLNGPNKREDVRWVLCKICCDIGNPQQSKMEEINLPVVVSLGAIVLLIGW